MSYHTRLRFNLVVIALLALSIAAYGQIQTEIHLIPDGTQGKVFIVQGLGGGIQLKNESGAKVYEIPSSRILVTSEPRASIYSAKYYYINKNGQRKQLEYYSMSVNDTPENRSNFEPFVWNEVDVEGNLGVPCKIRYREYYVGSRASLLARDSKASEADDLSFFDFVKQHKDLFCLTDR